MRRIGAQGGEFLEALLRPYEAQVHAPLHGWRVGTSKRTYLDQVQRVLHHIQRGDVYELNYCVERSTVQPGWDPIAGLSDC
jgi:anthranilate/para-aminobenzoate synthase component I